MLLTFELKHRASRGPCLTQLDRVDRTYRLFLNRELPEILCTVSLTKHKLKGIWCQTGVRPGHQSQWLVFGSQVSIVCAVAVERAHSE